MENRLGEVRRNSYGTEMKIVEYNGYENTVVEFQDEHKARVHTTYGNFIRSQVRNPYDKRYMMLAILERVNTKCI